MRAGPYLFYSLMDPLHQRQCLAQYLLHELLKENVMSTLRMHNHTPQSDCFKGDDVIYKYSYLLLF